MGDSVDASISRLEDLRDVLINKSGAEELAPRFRALFNLKAVGSEADNEEEKNKAIEYIAEAFKDSSELLKHEVAYVLGQTNNMASVSFLRAVLQDKNQEVIVRHEAAEALGALNDASSLDLLEEYYQNDPSIDIRQTCELSIARIKWQNSEKAKGETIEKSMYDSIDPAPPLPKDSVSDVVKLQEMLNDQDSSLFNRYRAMFRLRELGTDDACKALETGFNDPSALFRHEIAYVLGQLCNPLTVDTLIKVVRNSNEDGMVRHEATEALGSIATDKCLPVLKAYLNDREQIVKDSAVVALDMYEYENSNDFEYATVQAT